MVKNGNYLKGFICVIGAVLCFSFQPIFAYYAYEDGVNVYGLMFFRFVIAGVFLQVFFVRGLPSIPVGRPLLVGFLYSLMAFCYFSALQHISIGLTTMLLYMFPVYILGVSVFLKKEKATLVKMFAIAVAFFGVYLSVDFTSGFSSVGVMFGLGAAVFFGTYIMISGCVVNPDERIESLSLIMLGGIVSYSIPFVFGYAVFPHSASGYAATFGIGIICTVIPLGFLLVGVQLMGKDTDVAVVSTSQIVFTLFLAWLILDEPLTVDELSGAALVVCATLIIILTAKKEMGANPR